MMQHGGRANKLDGHWTKCILYYYTHYPVAGGYSSSNRYERSPQMVWGWCILSYEKLRTSSMTSLVTGTGDDDVRTSKKCCHLHL